MGPAERHEELLRSICGRGGHREGAEVRVRPLAAELGLELRHLFAAVVELVDMECLEYVGAGPVVRITALGAERCGHGDRARVAVSPP